MPWHSWFSMMTRKVCARVQSEEGVQGYLWVSSVFNQVDPVLGGCCKSHGPYIVGPSSATTPKRGSLTHDGATSNAASSPQDSPGSVDVLSEGLRFSVCSSRLIYCLVPQEQERIVLVWEL